ncbi:hypothetical protein LAV60_15515 [Clostridium sporogenes]|uniref:hypothetical protein n=1 Tax=Clostridium sporogenes TaxID=1509 RepID=UPI00223723EB|nr:hypothetical protein [Clostridium sporogenes]MCW6094579.1 hypothetical protein [Clostridium sporogenes]
MKVFINGKIREEGRIDEIISEVLETMSERIGVPEGTEFAIEDLEFKVAFNIDGKEQYATVPREVAGETVNEMFMVSAHLDKEGNLVQAEDNESESFYDGYTLAKAVGKEYEYTGTESKYSNDELEVIESIGENTDEDVMAVKYRVKASPEIEVVRHYKGNILIAEYNYVPKDKNNKSKK